VAPTKDRADLRIALVHDWLTVPGGSEDVFREVCEMYPGVVLTSQWDRARIKFIENLEVRTSPVQRLPMALTKHYMYAPILPDVYRRFGMAEFDVVLSDSHSFAHGVRKRPGALHVCYYHTPARSLWVPEIDGRATSGRLAAVRRLIARRLKRLDLVASKNADVILANSHTTADRIRKFYCRDVDAVIYPPVDTKKWADVGRDSEELGLLFWGRLIPYKRVDLCIEAVRRTGDRLQIVGSGPDEARLKALAQGLPNVSFHGRLPDEELKRLMARCRAVLFPAYEDFGIVPVEAMAAGLPVVAYGVGGASETVLPEFGVQFGVQNVDAMVEALKVLSAKRFDPEATRAHAAQFDVDRFRSEYRQAVDTAIESHFRSGATQS